MQHTAHGVAVLQTEMKLKAEVHIINRTNARLKADKAADTAKINEITKQVLQALLGHTSGALSAQLCFTPWAIKL